MKLKYILTASNENSTYLDFIPLLYKTWCDWINIPIKFILVMEEIPEKLKKYEKNIILFKPLANLSTVFQSQVIRLFYPALINTKEAIMITDMDMIPMNKKYFIEWVSKKDDKKFVNLPHSNNCGPDHIVMCYNIATPQIWGEIFNIQCLEDVRERLMDVHRWVQKNNIHYWGSDQSWLHYKIHTWKNKKNYIKIPPEISGTKLLCRNNINYILQMPKQLQEDIKNGKYSDYHMLRPYNDYKEINDYIVNLLLKE
jgi:hypothetical protein